MSEDEKKRLLESVAGKAAMYDGEMIKGIKDRMNKYEKGARGLRKIACKYESPDLTYNVFYQKLIRFQGCIGLAIKQSHALILFDGPNRIGVVLAGDHVCPFWLVDPNDRKDRSWLFIRFPQSDHRGSYSAMIPICTFLDVRPADVRESVKAAVYGLAFQDIKEMGWTHLKIPGDGSMPDLGSIKDPSAKTAIEMFYTRSEQLEPEDVLEELIQG